MLNQHVSGESIDTVSREHFKLVAPASLTPHTSDVIFA